LITELKHSLNSIIVFCKENQLIGDCLWIFFPYQQSSILASQVREANTLESKINAIKQGIDLDILTSFVSLSDIENEVIKKLSQLSDDGKFYTVSSADYDVNNGVLRLLKEPSIGSALTPSSQRMSGSQTTVIFVNGSKFYATRKNIFNLL
jgi:hypothetical protein